VEFSILAEGLNLVECELILYQEHMRLKTDNGKRQVWGILGTDRVD
jgi:hypothetical protein